MICILENPEQVSSTAAEELLKCAADAVQKRAVFRIALSGGSTPQGLYSKLACDPNLRKQMPWENTHFFWSDERTVPPDHPESNYRMVREAMLKHIVVSETQIHRIRAELPDAAHAAEEYEHEIRQHFKVQPSEIPQFDLILLGLGADGHTASLFPGTDALKETARLVVSNWIPRLNTYRITFTVLLLNRASCIIFLVCGEDKAPVLKAVLHGPLNRDLFPSQLIRPGGRLLWFVDQSAAKLLDETS